MLWGQCMVIVSTLTLRRRMACTKLLNGSNIYWVQVDLLWKLLYADDLVAISVSEEKFIRQELSYRKQTTHQLRTQYIEATYRSTYPWLWNLGQGSLKVTEMVPFESLSMVSYSPSIVNIAVSLAISQIFSIKEWPDLEIWVWGRSRSFKMVRFDRPCTTFY